MGENMIEPTDTAISESVYDWDIVEMVTHPDLVDDSPGFLPLSFFPLDRAISTSG
jgi:hypothetical protein